MAERLPNNPDPNRNRFSTEINRFRPIRRVIDLYTARQGSNTRVVASLDTFRTLVQNITSKKDDPPVSSKERDTEKISHSPEIAFIIRGELVKLVKRDIPRIASIGASMLLGRTRDLTKDSERLVASIESASVLGTENIPTTNDPIIIACNHPDLYDLVAGTIHISDTFNKERAEHGQAGDIRWLITASPSPREETKKVKSKLIDRFFDWGFKQLSTTYNLIPVPLDTDSNSVSTNVTDRAKVLFKAREHLLDTASSRIIGIYPEGDITQGETLNTFYRGIGVLARLSASSDGTIGVLIVPTGIYRNDKNQLTINFGEAIEIKREEKAKDITERVRNAISTLSNKSLS